MQYLLTQEEYNELLEYKKKAHNVPSKKFYKDLQKLCTEAADSIVLKSGWMKGNVWGCIISKNEGNDENDWSVEWYCDDCPARNVCPYEYKSWSK